MKESDFIYKGYNKYHLWTSLYYQYQLDTRLGNMSRKARKKLAVDKYLNILGIKKC